MPQLYALLLVQNVEPVGGQVPEWIERYIGGWASARVFQLATSMRLGSLSTGSPVVSSRVAARERE